MKNETDKAPVREEGGAATWHPLDENGSAEVRVNGKRITTMPSYPGAQEVADRINAALATRDEATAEAGEPKYFAAFMAEDGALRAQPQAREEAQPVLTVWYGSMPESNGRQNWTATLRRVNPTDKWDQGFCFARSEYPERVRYEADRMRWIIGELAEEPDILAYDEKAHSGYVAPTPPAPEAEKLRVALEAAMRAMTKIATRKSPRLDDAVENLARARKEALVASHQIAAALHQKDE